MQVPEEGLASQHASDPTEIRSLYDEWASGYDDDLAAWGYEAPAVAAELLAKHASAGAQIIDVGCGTGLVGRALAATGFHDVVGVDGSSAALDVAAKTGCYRALTEVDLTELPTELSDDLFGGLICVGVMTYLPDVAATCREFARIVEPDAPIVLTQRTDLFESRSTQAAFDALVADGTWTIVEITDPMPYLPNHPEYRGIDVRYGVFRSNYSQVTTP